MKTLLIALLLLLSTAPALAVEDEQLHAGAGVLVGAIADTTLYHVAPRLSAWGRLGVSTFGTTAALAWVNEMSDLATGDDRYGQRELLATLAGAAAGALMSELTNTLFFVAASDDAALIGVTGRW